MRILFVCIGNICRSPMAAAMAQTIGGPTIAADSAGLAALPGNRATPGAIVAADELGFDLRGHRARWIADLDLDGYDHVVALTPEIAARLRDEYDVPPKRLMALEVDDPYGSDLAAYRACARDVEVAVRALLDRIAEPDWLRDARDPSGDSE